MKRKTKTRKPATVTVKITGKGKSLARTLAQLFRADRQKGKGK